MGFLRKGFPRSANRRSELYCRIDPAPVAAIFFAFVAMFLGDISNLHAHRMVVIDRATAANARYLPKARREDAILISVTRDGSVYVRNSGSIPPNCPIKFVIPCSMVQRKESIFRWMRARNTAT